MRRALFVSAALGWLAGPAAATDVEAQLQAMQARMAEMEAKLESNQDELENANRRIAEQEQVIQTSGVASSEGSSGLASFLETIEITGWVAGSYWYNAEGPDGDSLGGFNRGSVLAMPFQPDPNSFSLDQLWFGIERPVSDENRAGFRTDLVLGKTAGLLSGDSGANDGLSGNDLEMYQAYVQYRAPINEATTFKFGKFATLLGAEVVQSPLNFNISRGQVYNLFQPITHTGLLGSTAVAGVDVSLGFVDETRSFPASDIDLNTDKAFIGAIGQSFDSWKWSFAGVHGSADSGALHDEPAANSETILDLILGWTPNDKFSAYVNADWIQTEISRDSDGLSIPGFDVEGYGVAVAGRYAITDATGVALRGEYIDIDSFFGDGADLGLWTVTSTVDHKLTDQLTLRGELRYDASDDSDPSDDIFFGGSCAGGGSASDVCSLSEDDQFLAGVEVIYNF